MKSYFLGLVAVLSLVLLLPSAASAVDFGIYGSMYDSNDLSEAFGLGVVVAFDINEKFDFDINLAYFEDWENRFEDVEDVTKVELGVIPVDIGFNWHSKPDGGFAVGAGATYGFVDLGGLEINGVDIPDFGNADDEFGWFGRLGYRMPVGFFAEVLYRDLDVSIEDLRPVLVPLVGNSIDIDMGGWQVNLGWRW